MNLRRRLRTRRLLFRNADDAQHDGGMGGSDLEDASIEIHPLVHYVCRAVDHLAVERQMRDGHEALDVVADVDDDALVHETHDLRAHLGADRIGLADAEPRILFRLLEAEADPLVLGVDVQNHHVDRVSLLHHLRRMLHALRPAHVGDVNETVDAGLDLHERAEAGEIAHLAADAGAHRILERQHHPGILLRLLHAERDLLLVRIDLEAHCLDGFADGDELARMPHVARPAHLADVHQTLDARLQLDERAVVGDAHDLALHPRADRVLLGHVLPRVALELLEAERDALALPVDVQHLDLELRADLHELGRMRDAAPRHVGDVQQTVHAAEIDERTEVGDVLDHAFPDLVLGQLLHELLALACALALQDDAARDDDVPAALVELDDLELELLAEQLVDVRNATQRDLRAGQERVHAHEVHDHAALDLLDERAFHRLIVLVGEANALPHPHEFRLLLLDDNRPLLILEVLQQDFDFVARLEIRKVLELLERNAAFRLEADVEHDHVVANLEDARLDDLALVDRRHRAVVHLHHGLELVGRVSLVVHELRAEIGERAKLRALLVALLARGKCRRFGWGVELSHTDGNSPGNRGYLGSPRRVRRVERPPMWRPRNVPPATRAGSLVNATMNHRRRR